MSERVQRDEAVSEAAVMEVRKGNILFNGKELNSESGSASAAAPTSKDGLPNVDSDQSDGTSKILLYSYLISFMQISIGKKNQRIWQVLTLYLNF